VLRDISGLNGGEKLARARELVENVKPEVCDFVNSIPCARVSSHYWIKRGRAFQVRSIDISLRWKNRSNVKVSTSLDAKSRNCDIAQLASRYRNDSSVSFENVHYAVSLQREGGGYRRMFRKYSRIQASSVQTLLLDIIIVKCFKSCTSGPSSNCPDLLKDLRSNTKGRFKLVSEIEFAPTKSLITFQC